MPTITQHVMRAGSGWSASIPTGASPRQPQSWGASPSPRTGPSGRARATVTLDGTCWEFQRRQPKIGPRVGSPLPPAKHAPTAHAISTPDQGTSESNERQVGGISHRLPSEKEKQNVKSEASER